MDERSYSLNMKLTGMRLKKAIEESGYTAREIQSMLGMSSVQPIYRWKMGKSLPTLDNLYALCNILGVEIDYILVSYGDEKKARETLTNEVKRLMGKE